MIHQLTIFRTDDDEPIVDPIDPTDLDDEE